MSIHPDPQPLTVNQLRQHLDEIARQGGGEHPVLLPYYSGGFTPGPRPMLPLTGVDRGFDWEANKVLLRFSEQLSVREPKMQKIIAQQSNALMKIGLAVSRLGDDTLFPLADQVRMFKSNVSAMVEKGLSRPE